MFLSNIKIKFNYKTLFWCGVFGGCVLVTGGFLGFILIPNILDDKIWETKILKENTSQWQIFMKMPFPFAFKVYLFDVQNPEEILNGGKPIVKEVGPYVYRLFKWKNEVTWNYTTDEISYYEFERYEFDVNASGKLTENDMVTVVNVPYNSFLFTAESLQPDLLSMIDPALPKVFDDINLPFVKAKVKDFLFDGIRFCKNDAKDGGFAPQAICSQIKAKLENAKQMRVEGNDILYATFHFRNYTHQGYFTVNSGRTNRIDTSKLTSFQNKSYISNWQGDKSICNKIRGVTTVFPTQVDEKMSFDSFSGDICRAITMNFTGQEVVKDIVGFKFTALKSTFDSPDKNIENECFCTNSTDNLDGNVSCMFDGVLDLTSCIGAPVLVSFPHLLHADQRYLQSVDGLRPNQSQHESYVVLEPVSGTPLKMAKRIQFNMFVRPIEGISSLANVTHSLLPIFWIEESTELAAPYLDVIKYSLLRNLWILNIVRWTVVAFAVALIMISLFLFIYSK